MGCTASKLDNEDTVRRCKDRRRLMKEAVYARHNLATAHSEYLRSLRLTASALLEFASGEQLSVSEESPAILLSNLNNNSFRTQPPPPPPPPPRASQPPPPPPPPPPAPAAYFSPSPSSSPTIASSKLPHILSESSVSSNPHHHNHHQHHHYKKKKPPPSSSASSVIYNNSNYGSTPSQESSSVWDWENFYPPSPPGSDFFSRIETKGGEQQHQSSSSSSSDEEEEEEEEAHDPHHHHHQTEREEVHCSDWGDDRYSTTSSSDDDDVKESSRRKSEIDHLSRSNFHDETASTTSTTTTTTTSKSKFPPKPKAKPNPNPSVRSDEDAASSYTWNGDGGGGYTDDMIYSSSSDMKMVVRHKDLAEIAAAIKDYFDKAAASGESVSDLLEIGRAQLDRSFRQLKKTVYHSNSMLSSLSSGWTSKPPLAIKYRFDAASLAEPGCPKSHCSTLERLLAWEKKLYQEVKAREGVNIEHEKKLSTLQSQEYRGDEEVKLDKTKASIKRLQSLIVVTSQAASTTSSAILHVRDTELAPQLVELCHGFMYMWRSMNQFHEVQNDIIQQVRGLVNRAVKGASTSELHRQATRHLESAVSAWHTNFSLLIKYQRHYVRSLHDWFRLTLHNVGNENDSTSGVKDNQSSSAIFSFLDEWKQALDRLPDTVASEAIKSFVNVIHVVSEKQSEELKMKRRAESASKELDKKASALRSIEKKFYHSYSMVGIGLPDGGGSDGKQVFDARDPLAEKKQELAGCQRRVEDEMAKYAQAVEVTRAMTLNNIQTGLPGVFQAMASFSRLFMEALEGVCVRSYSIK